MSVTRNLGMMLAGAAITCAAFVSLYGAAAHTATPVPAPASAHWEMEVVQGTFPEAWKLNTQTGEIMFCSYNGAQRTAGCMNVPNPQ